MCTALAARPVPERKDVLLAYVLTTSWNIFAKSKKSSKCQSHAGTTTNGTLKPSPIATCASKQAAGKLHNLKADVAKVVAAAAVAEIAVEPVAQDATTATPRAGTTAAARLHDNRLTNQSKGVEVSNDFHAPFF